MAVGYLISLLVALAYALVALRPPSRPRWLARLGASVVAGVAEWPVLILAFAALATALAIAEGNTDAATVMWAAPLGAVIACIVAVLVARSLRAAGALRRALDGVLPPGVPRGRWWRVLFAPFPLRHPGVRRVSGIRYGPAARRNLLDLYRARTPGAVPGPVLIHLHGGGFRRGRRGFESRPLLHDLARRGWVCISADYRLHPHAVFPDFLIDAKRVIAWARANAGEHGGDPTRIVISGSSAGAHLALSAALTAGDPRFQPGFEDANTAVGGAVGFCGYYGPVDAARQALPSAVHDHAHPDAPPIMVIHGDRDSHVPVEHARTLVRRLRAAGCDPVLFAELLGAQHSFDLLRSARFVMVIEAVEAFGARLVRADQSSRSAS